MQKLLSLVIAVLFYGQVEALAGDRVGNGGDRIAAEFISRGYFLADRIESELISPKNRQDLLRAVQDTPVQVVNHDTIDIFGRIVDAIVIDDPIGPGKLIQLNRAAWTRNFESTSGVLRLVLHEYLRVMDIDDDQYRISSQLNLADNDHSRISTFPKVASARLICADGTVIGYDRDNNLMPSAQKSRWFRGLLDGLLLK